MYNNLNQSIKIQLTGELNSYSYDPKMKDYVINMIMQILNFPKKTKQARYFQQMIEQNKIMMIWYPMSIPFMNKNYDIPLKIFIPKNIPYDPPRIIIDLKQGFSFNYNNRDINQNNGEIVTSTLRNWSYYSDIENALNEIFISFCRVFPIYKPENNFSNMNNNNYNNNNYNYNNLNISNSFNISNGQKMQNSTFQPNQKQNNNVYNSCQNLNNNNNNVLRKANTVKEKNNQNQNNNNKIIPQNDNNKINKEDEKIKKEINQEENKVEEKIDIKNEYEKKIIELETKLSEAENLNEILLKKLDAEIKTKEEKEQIILDKEKLISEYKEKTIDLEEKIKELIEKNNSINKSIKVTEIDEKPFAVNFISLDQKIHYPISCKSSDLISRLEEELYTEYEEYKEYNTFLTVNGNVVKRFKTIGENKIKKGDAILVNVYDE